MFDRLIVCQKQMEEIRSSSAQAVIRHQVLNYLNKKLGTHSGKNGLNRQWKRYSDPASGYIDFTQLFDGVRKCCSLFVENDGDEQCKNVQFGIGSSDVVRVRVNGRLVPGRRIIRRAQVNGIE